MNLLQADYDNDGRLDVLVLRGAGLLGELGDQPPSLLRNRADGVFEDVTEAAGLLFFAPTQCGAWGDFDNDGRIDLFVGFESSAIPGYEVPLYQELPLRTERPSKLFRNVGNGKFTDVAASVGVNIIGYLKGAAWGDIDNDGFPELAIARAYGPALLLPNVAGDKEKARRFAAPAQLEPAHSASVVFFDYNQDGWLDLFVSGYSKIASSYAAGQVAADLLGQPHTAELPRLYRNNGAAADSPRFSDVTAEAGLNRVYFATGAVADDFDNDGWPDLYLSTGAPDYRAIVPNRMLRNDGGERFEDVSSSAGIAHLQKGSGVAVGDIDRDGDQDILQVLGGEFPGDTFPARAFHECRKREPLACSRLGRCEGKSECDRCAHLGGSRDAERTAHVALSGLDGRQLRWLDAGARDWTRRRDRDQSGRGNLAALRGSTLRRHFGAATLPHHRRREERSRGEAVSARVTRAAGTGRSS
jgi:hypothetical protein